VGISKDLELNEILPNNKSQINFFVTKQFISRWAGGKTIPDIKSIEQLAIIFNYKINDIFEENTLKELSLKSNITTNKQKNNIYIGN
jgi:transcriptional regulator with XRE-family HTH domain